MTVAISQVVAEIQPKGFIDRVLCLLQGSEWENVRKDFDECCTQEAQGTAVVIDHGWILSREFQYLDSIDYSINRRKVKLAVSWERTWREVEVPMPSDGQPWPSKTCSRGEREWAWGCKMSKSTVTRSRVVLRTCDRWWVRYDKRALLTAQLLTLDWWSSNKYRATACRWLPVETPPSQQEAAEITRTTACRGWHTDSTGNTTARDGCRQMGSETRTGSRLRGSWTHADAGRRDVGHGV